MGEVYRAFDTRLGRSVAIKVLPMDLAAEPGRLSRFEREAHLLASVNHPNIATVYGFFRDSPRPPVEPERGSPGDCSPAGASRARETPGAAEETVPYLVMELVEGEDLATTLQRRPLSAEEAVALFRQVADGLEAAHERGIVHRDLKPANLMTSISGQVKILDFGIAKGTVEEVPEGGDVPLKTATGLAVGTPGYMSPEQVRGKPVDKRTDIWSFGCVLFEALCGRSPFAGESPADRTAAMLTSGPDLAALPADLPSPLRQLIQRCLVADPRSRLRDIGEARVQLEAMGRHQLDGDTVSTGWHQTDVEWRPRLGGAIPGRPRWLLAERLAVGGFGEVWLARHQKTDEPRVFKFCFDEERISGLRREVALLRILRQALGDRSDIAQPLDWQLDSQPAFLEMEYSAGGDLRLYAERRGGIGEIPLDRRLEIVAQTAVALAAAHSVGVLHKDLKPANILVGDDVETGAPRARLSDFGIGLVLDRDVLSSPGVTVAGLTQTLLSPESPRGGTPLYLAPEIFAGKPATIQSDIYSLGVVLYQIAVGDLGRPLAPGWERDVDDDLLRADIAACVDGSPERRLASATELADRLRGLAARRASQEDERRRLEQEAAERRRAEREAARSERRRRQLLLAATVGVILTVVGAVIAWRERTVARAERALREDFRRRLYVSDMNLAGQAYSEGSLRRVVTLLDHHVPTPGQADLRQWEWFHWWHATHLESASTLQGDGPPFAPEVSPRGDAVAVVDFFGVLRLYDEQLRTVNLASTDAAPGGGMAFSPTGEWLATLARSGEVEIWSVNEALERQPVRLMRPARSLDSEAGPGSRGTLEFSPDRPFLAAGFANGRLVLWETSTWDLVATARAPGPVGGVSFRPETGQLIVATRSSGADRPAGALLAVYDLDALRLVETVAAPDLNLGYGYSSSDREALARAAASGVLATAGRAGVGLWSPDLESETVLATPAAVTSVALSPDGRHLAAGIATTAEILVWDLQPEPSLRNVLRGHEQAVVGIDFSADGTALFSAGQDQLLKRWDLAESVRFDRLSNVHLWGGLAYSDDGRFLSFSAGDWPGRLTAARWDTARRVALETPGAAIGFLHYAVSDHGGTVVGMTPDGEIRAGDLESGVWRSVVRLPEEEAATVGPLSVAPGGRLVAWDVTAKTPEKRVVVLDTETGSRSAIPGAARVDLAFGGPDEFPRRDHPTFSPDGTVLVEHRFGATTVWDLTAAPPALRYVSPGWGQESCASFSPDGRLLAICSQSNAIRVIDARTGELVWNLEGHGGYATSASFSGDGGTLVSVGSDSTVRLWDVESGQLRTTIDRFEEVPWRVAFSPRGDSLATVHGRAEGGPGARGELRVWRIASDPRQIEPAVEAPVDFSGARLLNCVVSGGNAAPPGSTFDLLLRLVQSGAEVTGEAYSPSGFRALEGTVEGGTLVYVGRSDEECASRSRATLEVVGGEWRSTVEIQSCMGEAQASCLGS
jgi:serine/threonine protein kinase/WD40 repeat protein